MNDSHAAELPLFPHPDLAKDADAKRSESKPAGDGESSGAREATKRRRPRGLGRRKPAAQGEVPSQSNESQGSQEFPGEGTTPARAESRGRREQTVTQEPGSDPVVAREPGGGGRPQENRERTGDQRQRDPGFRKRKGKRRRDRGRDGDHDRNRDRDREPRDGDRERDRDRESDRRPEVLTGPVVEGEGLLEISSKGFGFLRQADTDFQQAPSDVFVTPEVVRAYGLRDGMWLKCAAREGNRGPQLTELLEICGKNPEDCRDLPYFEELTVINPDKRMVMETRRDRYTTRVIDLITPIGRGQRGLIVAPPRTGKTTLLQHLAEAVHQNHESVKIFILLVDERPEEVTELRRALPYAEVLASSNDQDVKNHTRIAQLAIDRCKRLVETGQHVFLLLDSITRMARAFNNAIRGGGNRGTASGGLAVGALETPRRLFAAARNTREGGSLTIVGTALVETNSRMDDAIFQEFKGTGNMELVLDRKIAEQYIWPAVNIHASGTRREELLLPPHQLEKIHVIRRGLAGHKPVEAMERLLSLMERFPSNAQMLVELKSGGS